jgi:hypothetical protein
VSRNSYRSPSQQSTRQTTGIFDPLARVLDDSIRIVAQLLDTFRLINTLSLPIFWFDDLEKIPKANYD